MVFRASAGVWYVLKSGGGSTTLGWGTSGDVPVAADFDGDGKADATVFRPSSGLWFVNRSTGGTTVTGWGTTDDIPINGDQNGDGRAGFIVWRPSTGTWYTQFTGGGSAALGWGTRRQGFVTTGFDARITITTNPKSRIPNHDREPSAFRSAST